MVTTHLPHFNLIVNGEQAPRAVMNDLLECTVENSVHLPDVCTLRIHDATFHWIDSDMFAIGASIEVSAFDERNDANTIFYGEVTAHEMDLSGAEGVPTIIVRCFDRSHRLHRGRTCRTWNGVKDSEIVKEIGREVGLKVIAKSTPQIHDWVIQNNQTNWEFLCDRAARNGYRLYLRKERELVFEPVDDDSDEVLELEFGEDTLRSFRPRMTASHQVDEVVVRGWCPKEKRPIVGKCSKPKGITRTGDGKNGGQVAKGAFGPAKLIVVDRPVHSDKEAEAMAQSILDEISGDFIEAEGVSIGNPHLLSGRMVEIKNIGKKFSTKYYVTSTTHVYSPAEGYTTMFSVSGKSPSTLLAMLSGDELAKRSPVGGNLVVGVVTDNKDPDGLCRVKVKYPWLTEDHTSFWARQSSQMAGGSRGMFNIPEIGDEVLIAFEHGEVSRPYVLGQLWNGVDKPPGLSGANPMHGSGSVTNRRGFYSRVGHMIDIDDTGGGGIQLTTQAGVKVHCTDDGPTIVCSTPGGQSVTITDAGSLIKLQDNAGDVITMSNGNINATATTMMNLSAPMINISGTISVTVNGMAIALNAGAMATVTSGVLTSVASGNAVYIGAGANLRAEAGAKAEVQGKAGLELDGTTGVQVKGATIKLN